MKPIRKRLRSSKLNENRKEKEDSPNFLLKLYQILNTNEYNNIINWSDNGKYFIVNKLYEFTEQVLPHYYKHNNYSSFVRQLNMYDFHKKRNNQNKHVFQHKLFINGQKELIKTIKRKNKNKNGYCNRNLPIDNSYDNENMTMTGNNNGNDNGNNVNVNANEQALVEYCNEELISKKASKTNLEKALNYLLKSIKESKDKQNELENKVEKLGKQNEDFLLQNEQMLQEIIAKTEYNKKLEVVVYYILEMTMKKTSIKGTEPKNVILSSKNQIKEDDSNILKQLDYTSIQNIIPKASTFSTHQSSTLKSFLDKYIESTPNCTSKAKTELPMLLTNGEELNKVNSHLNGLQENNGNSNNMSNNLNGLIIPPASPLYHYSNNMSPLSPMSPLKNSPRIRKSSHDSALSMQIEDELFKNSALRKIITNTIHSNQNILLKADEGNNNNNNNSIHSINDSIMNSIHSRNLFDLDFNFEDTIEHNDNNANMDKKNANRLFFEYDNLSSL